MLSREELRRAAPTIETPTTKYVKGEISKREYEEQVQGERESYQQPPGEQSG